MRWGRNRNEIGRRNDTSARQIIQSELNHGEKLIWADRPISVARHFKSAIPLFFFGAVFAGIALLGVNNEWENDGMTPILLVPSLFVLIGFVLMLSPFWRMKKAKSMVYAFTDQRMIIRQNFPKIKVRSWPLSGITSLERDGPAEGPGDLIFADETRIGNEGHTKSIKIGFIGIDQPKRLEDDIREQLDW